MLPSTQFTLGGQRAWFHDESLSYGYFHTYDAFTVGDAARTIHVFLPWSYEHGDQRYPVVYMNDGDVAFWPGGSAYKSWRVAQTLAKIAKEIQEVIVVAIRPHDRNYEYTHTPWAGDKPFGGVAGYSDYLAEQVKAFIDSNYRTLSGREETAIVGSSHGGLAAFYTACRRPESFGVAGVLSPSFWVGPDFDLIASDAPLSASALIAQTSATLKDKTRRPRLWIDWGLVREGGFHNSVIEELSTKRSKEMIELLIGWGYSLGEDLRVFVDPAGGHDEDAWQHRLGLLLQAFYPLR